MNTRFSQPAPRRVLVTGANKGIGLACVSAILENYEDVIVLLGTRDPERGQAALALLSEQHANAYSQVELLEIDVCDPGSIALAAKSVAEKYPEEPEPLYAVVNNAGIGFGSDDIISVVDVNVFGVKRVCDTFLALVQPHGRVVNVSSAAGPKFVSQCSLERQAFFCDSTIEWSAIAELVAALVDEDGDSSLVSRLGLGELNAYGFSKACTSLYTLLLARTNPGMRINACTPGFIETDLTRPMAQRQGMEPADLGMKPPEEGTASILHLLFGESIGSGYYYGSDAKRSPLHCYRAPGSPEYTGH